MKKSFSLLGTAALSSMLMVACSDDSTNNSSSENANACSLTSTEDGLAIKCGSEEVGIIKNSKDGVYGASCMAEALRDDSGYKLVCGGDSVGVVYNGAHGINGENGTNGNPGKNGEAGTSCYAKATTDGYNLFCGDELVGEILSGARGSSCAVASTTTGAVISCEDGTTATLSNGSQGLRGLQGEQGEGCTTDGLKYTDAEDGRTYAVISCGDDELLVYDGEKGATGAGCTAIKDTKTGVTTVSCGDDEVEILDGAAGVAGTDGKSCSVSKDAETGVVTIECETGDEEEPTVSYTVSDGAAGENGKSCSVVDNEDGSVTITCGTGADATTSTILAAGYATCGTGATASVYNTLTHDCVAGAVTAFDCGSKILASTEFCENGVAYAKANYWTAATTYPKADYFWEDDGDDEVASAELYLKADYWNEAVSGLDYPVADYDSLGTGAIVARAAYWDYATNGVTYPKTDYEPCGTEYYATATQFCSKYNTVVDKCGEATFDPATQYCKVGGTDPDFTYTVTNIYAACGTALYDTRTHFCIGTETYDLETYGPCGETYYIKGTQTCEAGVVTAIAAP